MGKKIVVRWLYQEATLWSSLIFSLLKMLRFISIASLALGALAPFAAEAASSCGYASYYGPGFHGRTTANGERFNSRAMTAAHRSLPFGSRVRVTNQSNGRSVVIRVNDDGPAYSSRLIDLSEGAFAQIASTSQGLARVCISRL
jgi:rare lipoprotein A